VCELTEIGISYFLRLLPQSWQALFVCRLYGVLLFDVVIAKYVPFHYGVWRCALWVSQAAVALVWWLWWCGGSTAAGGEVAGGRFRVFVCFVGAVSVAAAAAAATAAVAQRR
jgi:hypothetical protein